MQLPITHKLQSIYLLLLGSPSLKIVKLASILTSILLLITIKDFIKNEICSVMFERRKTFLLFVVMGQFLGPITSRKRESENENMLMLETL